MKEEYDFSNAERSRFYHPDAKLNIPLYLDSDVECYFLSKTKAKGVNMQEMVNEMLRKDISLAQEATE